MSQSFLNLFRDISPEFGESVRQIWFRGVALQFLCRKHLVLQLLLVRPLAWCKLPRPSELVRLVRPGRATLYR